MTITHHLYGTAVIRDQKPMPPDSLEKVLVDTTPQQWYEFLNAKSFFWVTKERLMRLLGARLYRNKLHDVVTVDTALLVERHLGQITLSPFNSGVSTFGPTYPRSADSFKTIRGYPSSQIERVVELVVDRHVPDIGELTISVGTWKGPVFEETIWRR